MSEKISRCIDVAVPVPIRGTLTYAVPEGLAGSTEPGARAVVPVGRRLVTGVIVPETPGSKVEPSRVRDIADLPDDAPLLPPDIMALASWASRYYVAPEGSMFAATIPPGVSRRSEIVVLRQPGAVPANGGSGAILARIPEEGISLRDLGASRGALRALEKAGAIRLETVLKGARVKAKFETVLHAAAAPGGAFEPAARAPRQVAVLALIRSAGARGVPSAEIEDRLGPSGTAIKALIGKKLIVPSRVEVERRPAIASTIDGEGTPIPEPTVHQRDAIAAIAAPLCARKYAAFLLMGVTGSGKTEVYLRAIERCLKEGRNALYLVPEIALTALLARNLRARLGDSLAILHSSLGPGERFDEWRRARQGKARIVLGARSAVLAPVEKLGLVIVDEEQDGSFKQEEDPRYNARDLALVRAKDASACVVLGSATPSVESYHAALNQRLTLLTLPHRIFERPLARVTMIDMRERFERTGKEELIAAPLADAVRERLAKGEQAIILLNRRGYAPVSICRSCGSTDQCKRCSVSLTYHRSEDRMLCHYCGYRRGKPTSCGTCGSDKVVLVGAGTERLEERFRESFPEARLARLDRDTARGRRAATDILEAFERGATNLLVGTQMVAKGHDFPGVTIVGVLNADAQLSVPEFRSSERTFQLLTQVAGRSGRGTSPGEVMVQAYHSDHYAMTAAVKQDYQGFFEKEIRFRRVMKYPPFVAMANLIVHAPSPEAGVRRVHKVASVVKEKAGPGMAVLGPSVAPLARLKGRYRYQVIVKAASRRKLSDALNETVDALSAGGLSSPRDLIIDVDPVSLS